jgi:transcriptional regulator with XRE-family HTH domain
MPIGMADTDTRRYIEVLRELMDRSGNSRAQVEQKLGWARGQLTKLLRGTYNLKVAQVLAILDTIGVEPLRFYSLVHENASGAPDPKSDLTSRVLQSFAGTSSQPLTLPPTMTADELEARIEVVIERALSRRNER